MQRGGPQPPASPADHDLVRRLQVGEREAGGLLYERYYTALLRVAHRYTIGHPGVAEDMVHEAFADFLEAVRSGKYRERRRLWSYLARLTVNACLDHVRKASSRREHSRGLGQPGDGLHVAEEYSGGVQDDEALELVLAEERLVAARRLLETLPDKEAAVITLAGAEVSMRQSASQLDTTIPAIKARLWRGRAIAEQLIAHDPRFDALRAEGATPRRLSPGALPKPYRTLTEGAAES
jgi:RNA polymerase sigma-70 factor, ECF subfamily